MRRKLFRILGTVALAVLVFEMVSCRVYDAVARTPTPPFVLRDRVSAANGHSISFLAAPMPNVTELPRLIYVHGTPGDANAFDGYLTNPVPGFDAISIDRPGFGHTTPRTPVYTLRAHAESLEPLLVNRAGRGAILVGHSLGGPIIVEAALR